MSATRGNPDLPPTYAMDIPPPSSPSAHPHSPALGEQHIGELDASGSWPRSWEAASFMYCRLEKQHAGGSISSDLRSHPEATFHPRPRALDTGYQRRHEDDALTSPLLSSLGGHSDDGSAAGMDFSFNTPEPPATWNSAQLPQNLSGGSHGCEADYILSEEQGTASFWQTVFNAVNILCGVGLLATPYAAASSGWSSLTLLVITGAITCYTGQLLVSCMQARPGTQTYPDIGWQAFGHNGKLVVAILLYLELFCCCVDFIILQGDTLAAIFPSASLHWGPVLLTAQQVMMVVSALVVLPTVWLRDLSVMSFLSLGGFSASAALFLLVIGQALVYPSPVTRQPVPFLDLSRLPISIGLYSFCFAGHAVFPSLYTSMRHKRRFGQVLAVAFATAVLLYGGVAIAGAATFGRGVRENVTLSMRQQRPNSVPAQLSTWLVVVSPATKFAMTMAPIAMAVEELGPVGPGAKGFGTLSFTVRTCLLGLILGTAVAVPFFAYVMSFIGAFLSMSLSVVAPCIFHLAIYRTSLRTPQMLLNVLVVVLGVGAGGLATYESIRKIVRQS